MNKTFLIAQREFITRIRNKTFILSTLLTPLLFIGIIGLSTYFAQKNDEEVTVAVFDESNLFASKLKSDKNITYTAVNKEVYDSVKKGISTSADYSGVLYIPAINIDKPEGIAYISSSQLGIFNESQIEETLNEVLKEKRMIQANIDTAQLNLIKQNPIQLKQSVINKEGSTTETNSGISYMVGYVSGMLIYMVMFIYGAMVMRGVMEEKINRIAEVIISSVKPTQLMMGKIVGIGAVGLVQFIIWLLLITLGTSLIGASASPDSLKSVQELNTNPAASSAIMKGMQMTIGQINMPLILGMFLFYFITGYLFYASLFAAVGSAVNEDPQDAQSMMFPITIPIIFSLVIMSSAITNPTGPLAVWCSIIPFTSPIIMMARLPFGAPGTVPYWQIGLSMVMMIIGILTVTWLSARIYRTGILMYGKKPSWKELMKWLFIKQ